MSEGITFNLSEREEMLREAAREFAAEVIRPAAPHHDSTGEYAWDVLTQAGSWSHECARTGRVWRIGCQSC